MTIDSPSPNGRSDADLIASVRAGRIEEYGTLYDRHATAATRLARHLCPADADAVVAESFATVLDALRDGEGPDHAFRAYLLATVRRTAHSKARASGRVRQAGNVTAMGAVAGTRAVSSDPSAGELEHFERSLVARAFHRLPGRWQTVLWHMVIEQQPASEVAPLLGISPGAVPALAYRARASLRQEYLQAHLAETSSPRCRATATKLGAWTRDGLSLRERAQVEQHLDHCARCRALADELADVNASLRGVVAFLVLGSATLSYLTDSGAASSAITAVHEGTKSGEPGPRQFLGVAVSGVALATAVAVALGAGGVGTAPVAHRPQEGERPLPPPVTAPATPSPTPVGPPSHPSLPPLPAPELRPDSYRQPKPPLPQSPETPPVSPPPVPPPPPFPPAGPATPAEPAAPAAPPEEPLPSPGTDPGGDTGNEVPPPEPAPRPQVSASVPGDGIRLDAGGEARVLDVALRNDGEATAADTAVALTLPDGVTTVAQQPGEGAEPGDGTPPEEEEEEEDGLGTGITSDDDGTPEPRTDSGQAESTAPGHEPGTPPAVSCPPGQGTVVCEVPGGLEPREREVVRFRVTAAPEAESGAAEGRVTVAGGDPVRFTVPITVRQDVAGLDVGVTGRQLHIEVRNEGVRPAIASVSVSLDVPGLVLYAEDLECEAEPLHCVSPAPLDPGQSAHLEVFVPLGHDADAVTVTASVGEDTTSEVVELMSLLPLDAPEPEASEPGDSSSPSSSSPSPTSPSTTPAGPDPARPPAASTAFPQAPVSSSFPVFPQAPSEEVAEDDHAPSLLGTLLRQQHRRSRRLRRRAGFPVHPRPSA
ncbi:sigma-70 family RNA polymerase sigma factor [Saccharomonospora xinjiangensis]|uniref:sigma-70 family RNA polymerase sigma factor n=2 Tax=Saccharomonospora xinjiangensis TaxID=75294 RepID=UPI0010C3A885|nr:sigma-70 family RNA polymerase sigma factor [Saccharomonospora xinjiangensis]QBQ59052.1 RNA polymerase sigma factor [Saccharomonospora xinjiangensis]